MLRALALIACCLVAALVGCGGSSDTGTLSGTVTFVGGPWPGQGPKPRPLHKQAGRVLVLDPEGHTVASQRVQRGQRYSFQLAPNRYKLALAAPGSQSVCRRGVRLAQGETTRANVTCQIP